MIVEPDHKYKYVATDADIRVLAIDDDPILREFALVYLTSPTVTVETADCGEAGLERLSEEAFDLVLCDIDMPGISGFEVLRAIRADPRLHRLPVIIVTSNEDMVSIDRAYEEGATSFVVKPINWRLLSYQIRFAYRASNLPERALVSG